MTGRTFQAQPGDLPVIIDDFGKYSEVLSSAADQLTGLRRSERPAARENQDGFQDAGFTRAIASIKNVKPRMGGNINRFEVSEILNLEAFY